MELLQSSGFLGFESIKYIGAFSFAAGMSIMFIKLYVQSVRFRVEDTMSDRDKWIDANTKLMIVVEKQAEALKEFSLLKDQVNDLSKRVIRIESKSD